MKIRKIIENQKITKSYLRGEITHQELIDKGIKPVKVF